MKKEFEILSRAMGDRGLRRTAQRENILKVFLAMEGHFSIEDICGEVKKQFPSIGNVTVYRTMKLFEELGLAEKMDRGDGIARYEHKYNHKHHDHLVCVKCGACIEAVSPQIEKLQEALARKYGFMPAGHKLRIFGICKNCR
jgi:Fur family ferric uptake transcriptional regulator